MPSTRLTPDEAVSMLRDRRFTNIGPGYAEIICRRGDIIGLVHRVEATGEWIARLPDPPEGDDGVLGVYQTRNAAAWACVTRYHSFHTHRDLDKHANKEELIGRMKTDGLITQTRDGKLKLRSYGKEALDVMKDLS